MKRILCVKGTSPVCPVKTRTTLLYRRGTVHVTYLQFSEGRAGQFLAFSLFLIMSTRASENILKIFLVKKINKYNTLENMSSKNELLSELRKTDLEVEILKSYIYLIGTVDRRQFRG